MVRGRGYHTTVVVVKGGGTRLDRRVSKTANSVEQFKSWSKFQSKRVHKVTLF